MPARTARSAGLLLAGVCIAGPAPAALPQQTIRSSVRVVPVYATVTDGSGALVTGLGAADFEVADNGRKEPIAIFTSDAQPISIAILLDNSPSLFAAAARTEGAVRAFAQLVRRDDRACLGTFAHVVSLVPDLTSDPDRLVRHLGDDVPYPAGTALWDALEAGRAALARETGRRVILVVTDAQDNCSRASADVVRTALVRDGVTLYGIGVRGGDGLGAGELSALAQATGGWYVELKPDDDVGATVLRIADELHRQYLLGFAPRSLDDRMHRIDVKVTKPGYTVRARRSYFASSREGVR